MHLMTLRLGSWQFSPTLWPTVAMVFFFALTLSLGNWQSNRAEEKRDLQARYDRAAREAAIHVGASDLDRDSVLYRKLEAEGVFDDRHTILIDNRVLDGVAGYHVLTPLRLAGSGRALLVNRGWAPAGRSRNSPPVPPVPEGPVRLEGMAADPHTRYFELGEATREGRVWQNLDFDRYAAITRLELQPVLLLQTSALPDGLQRRWPRPDTGIATHLSYAFQWYSLAATLVALWLILNFKRDPGHGMNPKP